MDKLTVHKIVKRIVRSTLAGETLEMSDGSDNRAWPHSMLHLVAINCGTDKQSPGDAMESTKSATDRIGFVGNKWHQRTLSNPIKVLVLTV